jgi:hypothetical protein
VRQQDRFAPIEWEIWHTYSTYIDGPSIDLEGAAKTLIDTEIAECVVSSAGQVFWKAQGLVVDAALSVIRDTDEGRLTFTCTTRSGESLLPAGFALEALGQAVQFIAAAQRVLGPETPFSEKCLRVFLSKVVARFSESEESTADLNLYPVLVIYESGVFVLEFRMIGPIDEIDLERFISYGVNLPRLRVSEIRVGPGLARMATEAYHRSAKVSIVNRFRFTSSQTLHNLAIKQLTAEETEGDGFTFKLSPWSGETQSFRDIAMSIFHTCAYLSSGPRRGLAFLLLGPKPAPDLGAFWSGRPHVHLIRFKAQKKTSQLNNRMNANAFYSILARTPSLARALPQDLRYFEDYSAFITSSASLWAWSQDGVRAQQHHSDPNRANFIYERQLVMELLEYGYMLHRGFYHRVESLQATSQVMNLRRLILQLRLHMREVSHSGEIRDLLEEGWKQLGLPALVIEIDAGLALREAEIRSADSARATRVGWAIATVFGIVAVPALADQVVAPAWHLAKLKVYSSVDLMKLVYAGVATTAIIVLLSLVLLALRLRREQR